jgi:[acyl-carrier-protein] S-malonyltransferase
MGLDLYEGSSAARDVYDTADGALGYRLSEICFQGPDEKLRQTEYTQPAIFVTSLACLASAIEAGLVSARPAFMAGHSLGEYSALVASGAMSFEDGLLLLAERARLMAEAGRQAQGAMAAVMGLAEDDVTALCAEADADVSNLNLMSQTVIGGTAEAVERAMELARQRGASRVQALNVSGAFHTRLMAPAVEGLVAALGRVEVQTPLVPVVANVSASPLLNADAVRRELTSQVASPVRWHESVTLMAAAGVQKFTEFGPGRVLTGLAKRIAPEAALVNVSSLRDARGGVPA